jgi:hypothetical protein
MRAMDWEVVYSSENNYRAEIVKGVLEEHQINAIIINKKDSNYHFGHSEVAVRRESILQAIKIIKDEIKFK